MKKNTLLYLDSGLVEAARKANLNISRLVEETLRRTLEIDHPRTAGEYLQRLIADSDGAQPSVYGEAYRLPLQIESLGLENIGLFENARFTFKKDALNVICGANASGKSTIVRSILFVFGRRHNYFGQENESGRVTLKLVRDGSRVSVTTSQGKELMSGYSCLILDDALAGMPKEMRQDFCQELVTLKVQTIMTASISSTDLILPRNTNIISLRPQKP